MADNSDNPNADDGGNAPMANNAPANPGAIDDDDGDDGDAALAVTAAVTPVSPGKVHYVNARDGVNLRPGPGTEFSPLRSLPFGTRVFLIRREDRWGLIDEQGDGAADGFVHMAYLIETPPADVPPSTTTIASDDVWEFWSARNPRHAKLHNSAGKPMVDPQLLHASAIGVTKFESLNPNYRVEIYGPGGGFRTGGSTSNHGAQPGTGLGAALDFVLIDQKTGKWLTNHPGSNHQYQGKVGANAPLYQKLYNEIVRSGAALYIDFEKRARFGGYFASGANAMDTMHIDMRGKIVSTAGGSLKGGFTAVQMAKWKVPTNHPY